MTKMKKKQPYTHLAKRNPITLGLIVICIIGFIVYFYGQFFRSQNPGSSHGGHAMPVEAVKVHLQTVEDKVVTVGNIIANESVIIQSEIAGRIKEILFKEGTETQAGALLFTLDDEVHKAELAEAEANLALSKGNFDRVEKLFKEKFKSTQEQDKAISEFKRDKAIFDKSRARLAKTKIFAPMNGILGLRQVSPGDYVIEGQELINLENINPVNIDFKLPERYVSRAKVGQVIHVKTDALPKKVFMGKVYAINPLLDENGRSLALRAEVPNPQMELLPGMFVTVTIILYKYENALVVPEEALVPKGEEHYVYRVIDHKAKFTKVNIGIRVNGKVQILSGLSPQDVVITAGQVKIQDGSDVKIITAKGPTR